MSIVNSDMSKFNQYVKLNTTGLQAHREKSDDLILNLFMDYLVTSDMKFVRSIKTYKEKTTTMMTSTLTSS